MPGAGATGIGKSSKFEFDVNWRFAESDMLYNKGRKNHALTRALKPVEDLSVIDMTATYAISQRASISANLPIAFNKFALQLPPEPSIFSRRFDLPARGIGDISLVARTWLFNQKKHPFHNVRLGGGLKFATGNWAPKSYYPNIDGFGTAKKTVYPPAIIPGDGGLGVIVDAQAYKTFRQPEILRGTSVFASAAYLITPKNTNSAPSVLSGLGLAYDPRGQNALRNSVADTYAVQTGFSVPIPRCYDNKLLRGIRILGIARYEGLKQRDIIGRSDGFRQPGYILTLGPAVSFTCGKNSFTVEVPITYNRHIDPGNAVLPGNVFRTFGTAAPAGILVRYARVM